MVTIGTILGLFAFMIASSYLSSKKIKKTLKNILSFILAVVVYVSIVGFSLSIQEIIQEQSIQFVARK